MGAKLYMLLSVTLILGGCRRASPQYSLVSVEGRVTYRGRPVKKATIQLVPEVASSSPLPSAAGETDMEGHFVLDSPPHGKGVAVGKFKAIITGYAEPRVPPQYSNPATSILVTVPAEGLSDLNLELRD